MQEINHISYLVNVECNFNSFMLLEIRILKKIIGNSKYLQKVLIKMCGPYVELKCKF